MLTLMIGRPQPTGAAALLPAEDGKIGEAIRMEQIVRFAGQQALNSAVTIMTAVTVCVAVWNMVPRWEIAVWGGAQIALALLAAVRWLPKSWGNPNPHSVRQLYWEAALWKLLSGGLWGAIALWLTALSPPAAFFLIIIVAALVAGASSTLAAVLPAAVAFIFAGLVPFAVALALGGTTPQPALGALALLFAVAMAWMALINHRTVRDSSSKTLENTRLRNDFEAERREWLELSEGSDGIGLFDDDNRLLLWNRRFGELLELNGENLFRGAELETLLEAAAKPLDVVSGRLDEDAWTREQLLELEADTDAPIYEYVGRKWLRRKLHRNISGGVSITVADMTALQQAAAATRENTDLYKNIAETTPTGIFIYLEGDIVYANNAAAALFHAPSPAFLTGRNILELVHPADRHAALGWQTTTRSDQGTAVTGGSIRMQCLDGTYFHSESVTSNIDWRGRIGTLAVFRDVSGRIAANQALRESEERYRNVIDYAPDAVVVVRDGKFVFANPTAQKMYGAPDSEILIGRDIIDFVHPDDRKNALAMRRDLAEGRQPRVFQLKRLRLNGDAFATQAIGVQMPWDGAPALFLYIRAVAGDNGEAAVAAPHDDSGNPAAAGVLVEDCPAVPEGTGETVLVVEDDADVRACVCGMLREMGYRVIEAANGSQAVVQIEKTTHIDLMIIDLVLPDSNDGPVNGADIAARIREILPDVPALFMSGYAGLAMSGSEEQPFQGDFIGKPLRKQELMLRVRSILGNTA